MNKTMYNIALIWFIIIMWIINDDINGSRNNINWNKLR